MKEDDWYVQQAKDAMADGSLVYAGKYSAPDYEHAVAGMAAHLPLKIR